jgi:hypothetical protein
LAAVVAELRLISGIFRRLPEPIIVFFDKLGSLSSFLWKVAIDVALTWRLIADASF